MKKPYSKYMDDKTIGILQKSIKAAEVQRTIEMIDTLILFYCENGLDIDEEDDDSDSDISYSNEQATQNENNKNMNTKIIDYMILSKLDTGNLEEKVKFYLNQGWQPLGGLCNSAMDRSFTGFHQVLVKYATKK